MKPTKDELEDMYMLLKALGVISITFIDQAAINDIYYIITKKRIFGAVTKMYDIDLRVDSNENN